MIFPLSGRQFHLAKIGLMRAACPEAVKFMPGNKMAGAAIIILKNEKKYGYVDAASYCPVAYVAAGEIRRQWLFANGVAKSWAFVECGSLQINADDAIGCRELMDKLDALLVARLVPVPSVNSVPGSWPYIVETYPFENYFIYAHRGKKFRQAYALDTLTRVVSLRGVPVPVLEKFVDATTNKIKSELLTQLMCRWKNITAAVEKYMTSERIVQRPISAITGVPLPAMSASLVRAGVDPFDFAMWSSEAYADKAENGKKRPSKALRAAGGGCTTSTTV